MSNMNSTNLLRRRDLLAASLALPVLAMAQPAWPSRPIRMVVPSAAGGAPDIICRLLGAELGPLLGQPLVIDNKPGAGGSIGMNEVFRAAPDGHTLGYGNVVTLAINRSLYSRLPYDPDALTGVALLGSVYNALVVRNGLPVNTVAELVAYAKAHPGRLSMGSAGNGTTGHLGGELFKSLTSTFIVHVPYRGSPQAINDLMAGQIDLMFDNLSSIGSHIQAGRVRALGVSGPQRSALFPDLPTLQEAGVPGYETTAWGGIVGPAGLPAAVVSRLNGAINQVLGLPVVKEKYARMAFETVAAPPDRLMAMARAETPRWAEVIRRSGAKVE